MCKLQIKLFTAYLLLSKKALNPMGEGGKRPVAQLVKKLPNPVGELRKNQMMRIII